MPWVMANRAWAMARLRSGTPAHTASQAVPTADMLRASLWLEHVPPPESCSSSSPGLSAVRGSEDAAGEWGIGDCANDHGGAMTRPGSLHPFVCCPLMYAADGQKTW